MKNNEEIAFDESSGISAEEQRDIMTKINGIAERNRRSLSEGDASGDTLPVRGGNSFRAKKRGGFFPVLVNVIALVLLAGGFYLLSFFQGRTETRVREGTRVYNSAERALIDEIRRETASRIEAKENEISLVVSKLAGVDAELQELQSGADLTAEQQAAENRLRATQEEYRAALAALQDERSRILEESRARESELSAQLDARTREIAALSEESAAALGLARGELERLSGEQAQAANVESQLAAFFSNLNDRISENRLAEAAGIIQAMRDFLDTPAFQSLRSIQARKDLYLQSINSIDVMVDEARKNQASLALAGITPAGEMEKTIAALQDENALLKGSGSGLTERLDELDSQISALQNQNSALQRQNTELQTEGTTLRQTIAARDSAIGELQQQGTEKDQSITNLNNQLSQIRQALQALSE